LSSHVISSAIFFIANNAFDDGEKIKWHLKRVETNLASQEKSKLYNFGMLLNKKNDCTLLFAVFVLAVSLDDHQS